MDPTPSPRHRPLAPRRAMAAALALVLVTMATAGVTMATSASPRGDTSPLAAEAAAAVEAGPVEPPPGSTSSTTTTEAGTGTGTGTAVAPSDAAPSATGAEAGNAGGTPGAGGEDDDAHFPDVPVAEEHEPGGWWPRPEGPTGLAPNPVVFDLVADVPTDPELGEAGQQAVGGAFAADVGCSGHCIEDASASVGGVDARFEVDTDTKARIWVILDGGIGAKDSGTTLTEHYEVGFTGLTPDTTYHVTLVAEDEHGRADHRYGQIRTKERKVLVTFTSIDVIGDGDSGINRGEIEFFFWGQGDWLPELHQGRQKIKSGKSIRLGERGIVAMWDDAPRYLELAVQGSEYDCCHYCTHGTPPFEDFGASEAGKCLDLATATATIDLDHLTVDDPALPSWHDGYFRLVTEEHHLKFAVNGSIDVTYV